MRLAAIGHSVEDMGPTRRDVAAVLAGEGRYDDLDGEAQAVVRAIWEEHLEALRDGLDLEAEFRRSGVVGWVTADGDGVVVVHT